MGDTRFQSPYRWVKEAQDTASAIHELGDEEVIAALAAASRDHDPYLANVLATEALNRTVQKRAIVETAGEGMYAVNRLGCITFLNPAAEAILRCTLAEMTEHHVHEALSFQNPPGGLPGSTEDPALAAMRRGSVVHLEESIVRRRDGTSFPATATAAPILREGEAEGAVVILRDITERKESERARRESEGRLRAVVTSAPIVLFALDAEGVFTLVEGERAEALGMRPDEVLGRSIFEVRADDAPTLDEARQTLAGALVIATTESRGRMFEKHWAPLRQTGGALCVAIEVTKREKAERARRATEERFRSLFEHHPDGIGATDLAGRITDVNRSFEHLLGWSREELKGKLFGELVAPEDVERVESTLSTFGTPPDGIEFAMQTRDGRHVDVRGLAVPMIVDGTFVGFHGVVQDISGRKKAERELRESRESLQRIVNSLPESVLILDARGAIRFANDAAVQLLGRPRAQLEGMRLDDRRWEITTPQGVPIAPRDLPLAKALVAGDVVTGFVLTLKRSDGTRPVVRASLVPMRGPSEEIVGAVVSFLDITEATRQEVRLRQREEAYRALAENSPDLIVRIDHCLRHVYANSAFVAATGLPQEAILGKSIDEVEVFGPRSSAFEEKVREVFRRGKVLTVEHTLARPTGDVLMETRLAPEFSESGTVRYVLGISRDVTERKRHADRLESSNHELASAAAERVRQLDEAIADLRAFVAVAQERLAPSIASADTLLRGLEAGGEGRLDDRARATVARAREAQDTASRALTRLLELRQVAADEIGPTRDVELRDLLASAQWQQRCAETIASRGARVETEFEDAPRVRAPPEALAGLLADLVVDLLSWADPDDPVVTLRCAASTTRVGWAELTLRPNGPGLPPEAFTQMQEPDDPEGWMRAAAAYGRPAFRLALARRLARRIGGWLRVRESPDGIAVVQVMLPLAGPRPPGD